MPVSKSKLSKLILFTLVLLFSVLCKSEIFPINSEIDANGDKRTDLKISVMKKFSILKWDKNEDGIIDVWNIKTTHQSVEYEFDIIRKIWALRLTQTGGSSILTATYVLDKSLWRISQASIKRRSVLFSHQFCVKRKPESADISDLLDDLSLLAESSTSVYPNRCKSNPKKSNFLPVNGECQVSGTTLRVRRATACVATRCNDRGKACPS